MQQSLEEEREGEGDREREGEGERETFGSAAGRLRSLLAINCYDAKMFFALLLICQSQIAENGQNVHSKASEQKFKRCAHIWLDL